MQEITFKRDLFSLTKWKNKSVEVWNTTKYGWDQTAWFFLLLGSTVVVTQYIGVAGPAAALITILIFYQIGKAHYHLNGEKTDAQK